MQRDSARKTKEGRNEIRAHRSEQNRHVMEILRHRGRNPGSRKGERRMPQGGAKADSAERTAGLEQALAGTEKNENEMDAAEEAFSFAVDLTWCRPGEIGGIEACVRNLLEGIQALPAPQGQAAEEGGQEPGSASGEIKKKETSPEDFRCLLLVTRDNRDSFRHFGEEDRRFFLRTVPGRFASAGERLRTLQRTRRWIGRELAAFAAQGAARAEPEAHPKGGEKTSCVPSKREKRAVSPVVLLEPCGYHAFFGPCPGIRSVVVIHDLQPLDLPENFSRRARLGKRILLRNTFRRADRIVAVSDFTRDRILCFAPGTRDRLVRIYNPIVLHGEDAGKEAAEPPWVPVGIKKPAGQGENQRPMRGEAPEGAARTDPGSDPLRKYHLAPGGYYLTVSSLLPHKNLDTLLAVFARLHDWEQAREPETGTGQGKGEGSEEGKREETLRNLPCRLVIAGIPQDPTGRCQRALEEKIRERHLTSCITLTGRIPEAERNDLIRSCRAFLFPSLYEGFGMPCAEASLLGADVIASPAAAIPEAAGDQAIYVQDPKDPGAWLFAMAEREQRKKAQVRKGQETAPPDRGSREEGEKPENQQGADRACRGQQELPRDHPFDRCRIARQYLDCMRACAGGEEIPARQGQQRQDADPKTGGGRETEESKTEHRSRRSG
ncbi:MAG: glycosyltransferase family 4 protein [Lachnospiraceae bacterium]|jgi:glycosyltransferase involved in cell wall biosynthesis|nr:glycosyltransferase family 4 protein [Lachnospiraceae bacterium]